MAQPGVRGSLPPEEAALWARWRQGDPAAREALVVRHLPLVRHLAARFAGSGIDSEDLVQVGSLGLLKAIERFDPDRGLQFSTYAVPVILGELRRHLRDEAGAVKVSRGGRELANAARRERRRLTQELGREPTVRELAAALGSEPAELLAALEATRPPLSVYQEVGDDDDPGQLLDLLSDDDGEAAFRRAVLADLLDRLDPRLRTIVLLRYLGDRTQTEIAAEIGLSQGQVSRLERQALERLRALAHARDSA